MSPGASRSSTGSPARAPAEVVAAFLDEGYHLCSERTMHRALAANRRVPERRNQHEHPAHRKPELVANASDKVGFPITLIDACSPFTACYGLPARQVTIMPLCTEDFDRLVTTATAAITTGSSDSCPADASPTERCGLVVRRLS